MKFVFQFFDWYQEAARRFVDRCEFIRRRLTNEPLEFCWVSDGLEQTCRRKQREIRAIGREVGVIYHTLLYDTTDGTWCDARDQMCAWCVTRLVLWEGCRVNALILCSGFERISENIVRITIQPCYVEGLHMNEKQT